MSRSWRISGVVGWVVVTVLTLVPLLTLTAQSFATRWFFPDLVPRDWTTEVADRILGDAETRSALADSLTVGAIVTAVSLALAVPAARALVIGRVPHARLSALAFLIPTALPPVAVAMGLEVAFLRTGLDGGLIAVVLAHLVATLPYAVLLSAAALTRYDPTYERQAAVLGAGRLRILLGVFIPLARPGLLVAGALTFVVSWSQYLLTLLPGGGRVITLPVLLLASSGGGNPTATAVLALISTLPPAVAVLLVIRHLDVLNPAAGSYP